MPPGSGQPTQLQLTSTILAQLHLIFRCSNLFLMYHVPFFKETKIHLLGHEIGQTLVASISPIFIWEDSDD